MTDTSTRPATILAAPAARSRMQGFVSTRSFLRCNDFVNFSADRGFLSFQQPSRKRGRHKAGRMRIRRATNARRNTGVGREKFELAGTGINKCVERKRKAANHRSLHWLPIGIRCLLPCAKEGRRHGISVPFTLIHGMGRAGERYRYRVQTFFYSALSYLLRHFHIVLLLYYTLTDFCPLY